MKIYKLVVAGFTAAGLSLLVAMSALAAPGNTVTFSADSNINISALSGNLIITSGSAVASYSVSTTALTLNLDSGSSGTVKSNSGWSLSNNGGFAVTCSGNASVLSFTASSAATVTITPSGTAVCPVTGGGGGGGGTFYLPTPSSNTGTITATNSSGGVTSLINTDGTSAKLTVPIGAVSSDTLFSITSTSTPPNFSFPGPAGLQIVGPYYTITATTGTSGAPVTVFGQNITLTLNYLLSQVPAGFSEASIGLYYFNTASGSWVLAGAPGINLPAHAVSASFNHLTTFAAFASGAASATVTPPATPPGLTSPANSSPVSGAHPDGTLILDAKTVYLIQNQQKMPFRDPYEYKSYGFKFSQAVLANDADRALPTGSVLKAFDGALALDASDNRTIYMVAAGTKRGFASLKIFKALGYKASQALKINLSDYPAGDPIVLPTDPHPNGALIMNKGVIYWIGWGSKKPFPSAAVFNSFGFSYKNAVKANSADLALPTGTEVSFRDGTLVNDSSSGAYYIISDGQKRPFASKAALVNWGYNASNAVKADISSYPLGAPL